MYAVLLCLEEFSKENCGVVVITSRKEISKRIDSTRNFSCFGVIC